MKKAYKILTIMILIVISFLIGRFSNQVEECKPQIITKNIIKEIEIEKKVEVNVCSENVMICRYAKIYRTLYSAYAIYARDQDSISETGELLRISDELNNTICKE